MATKTLVKTEDMFPVIFEDFFKPWNEWFDNNNSFGGKLIRIPAVNVTDNKDNYLVSLAVPGLKKSDFKINVEGNMLTISCEKEESKGEKEIKYTRKEYNYSFFSRSFTIPDEVLADKIEAVYEDGLLKLVLPKKVGVQKVLATKHIAVK